MATSTELAREATDGVKLSPSTREKLRRQFEETLQKAKTRRGNRKLAKANDPANRLIRRTIGNGLGGALAEPVRRSVVGRMTESVAGQSMGLGLVSAGVGWAADEVGLTDGSNLASGMAGVSGWMGAIAAYGKEDAVYLALEGTTHKAQHADDKKDE